MSKKANYSLIGAFVIGAVVLAAAAVVILGGGKFFKEKQQYVMYFEGSVKGLSIGAPVVFRGVKIGSVTDIRLRARPEEQTIEIPVFIEVLPGKFETEGEEQPDVDRPEEPGGYYKELLDAGLRARLQMQSFVTGQMMIELDFHPDTEIRLHEREFGIPEIPTIQSSLQQLEQTLQKLPLEQLLNKVTRTLEGIERKVNSPALDESIENLNALLKDTRHLIQNVDAQVEPLANTIGDAAKDYGKLARDVDTQVEPLAASIDSTVKDYGQLARDIDQEIEPLAASIREPLKAATETMETAKATLNNLKASTDEGSPTRQELLKAMQEISAAARSIRALTDYLKQHPESLLRGKGGAGRR